MAIKIQLFPSTEGGFSSAIWGGRMSFDRGNRLGESASDVANLVKSGLYLKKSSWFM